MSFSSSSFSLGWKISSLCSIASLALSKDSHASMEKRQGSKHLETHGRSGVKFVLEPEYNFMQAGREGQDKMNMLKRRIETGRYYVLSGETMVSRNPVISFQQSAHLGFLNMSVGDGVIQKQEYLELLNACCAFRQDTGALSPAYQRLVDHGGAKIVALAREVDAQVPSNAEGAAVDPFINWSPGANPSIVNYFGEQDTAYTSLADQEMIVDKVCQEIRKVVTPESLQSAKYILEKAAQWHVPTNSQYTEAFMYATYYTNREKGNGLFERMTELPCQDLDGFLSLSSLENDVVCHNVTSPGLLALVQTDSGRGLNPAGLQLIRSEMNAKMDALRVDPRAPIRTQISNVAHVLALVRDLVPDFTTLGNFRVLVGARLEGARNEDGYAIPMIAPPLIKTCFGIRAIKDYFPGFSRYQNMEALARLEPTNRGSLISQALSVKINEGLMAMGSIMSFLASTFSCPTALNYFFDWSAAEFDSTSPQMAGNTGARARSAGIENILFGRRYDCAFQRALDDYGFRPDTTERFTDGIPKTLAHEENFGLKRFF